MEIFFGRVRGVNSRRPRQTNISLSGIFFYYYQVSLKLPEWMSPDVVYLYSACQGSIPGHWK